MFVSLRHHDLRPIESAGNKFQAHQIWQTLGLLDPVQHGLAEPEPLIPVGTPMRDDAAPAALFGFPDPFTRQSLGQPVMPVLLGHRNRSHGRLPIKRRRRKQVPATDRQPLKRGFRDPPNEAFWVIGPGGL